MESNGKLKLQDLNHECLRSNFNKINKYLKVFIIQNARTDLKTNTKKINSLRLGVNEGEEVLLGSEKINQVDGVTYLGSSIIKVLVSVKM